MPFGDLALSFNIPFDAIRHRTLYENIPQVRWDRLVQMVEGVLMAFMLQSTYMR